MFSRYGRIVDIRLNRDRFTGRCKGFAFVAMARDDEVDEVSGRGRGGGNKPQLCWLAIKLCSAAS